MLLMKLNSLMSINENFITDDQKAKIIEIYETPSEEEPKVLASLIKVR